MRICLVSREYPPETGWGGIGTYTYHLAHGLCERGHRVHVIAQAVGGEREYSDGGVAVHRIRNFRFPTPLLNSRIPHSTARLKYDLRVRQTLKAIIRKEPIDIVESANFAAETLFVTGLGSVCSVVRLVTPLDTVLEMQGIELSIDYRLCCWFERLNTRNADGLITSSEAVLEHFRAFYALGDREIALCPLGIGPPDSRGVDPVEKNGDVLILFVGTLSRRKGVEELFTAARQVIAEFPNARFVLAGRDSVDEKGGSFIDGAYAGVPEKLRSRIRVAGYLPDPELRRHYRAADIVVFPSRFESFGLVYLEGMTWGKPLVVTGIPSAMEIVVPGETALVVPPRDPEALAKALLRLCSDGDLRQKLGDAGVRRAKENYTASEMARRTEEIYTRFLERKGLGRKT